MNVLSESAVFTCRINDVTYATIDLRQCGLLFRGKVWPRNGVPFGALAVADSLRVSSEGEFALRIGQGPIADLALRFCLGEPYFFASIRNSGAPALVLYPTLGGQNLIVLAARWFAFYAGYGLAP
jgi:hypothetical protein